MSDPRTVLMRLGELHGPLPCEHPFCGKDGWNMWVTPNEYMEAKRTGNALTAVIGERMGTVRCDNHIPSSTKKVESDQPKPPLSVWLMPRTGELGDFHLQQGACACDHGPYVHLDQFLEMVEARAQEIKSKHAWHSFVCQNMALKQIKQEVEEGKI